MPTRVVMPSVTQLAISILLDDPDLGALVGANVGPRLPAQPGLPFVTAGRAGGSVGSPVWIGHPLVAINDYAKRDTDAEHVATVIESLMLSLENVVKGDAVITGVSQVQGPVPLPEERLGLFRYLQTYELTLHPNPTNHL